MSTKLRWSHGLQVIVVLVLWGLWKAHPGVVICAIFWLSAIWMLRSTNVVRHRAGLAFLLGVVLNAAVTELNGGVMPVVGMPTHFRAASPVWQAAQRSNHLLFLADHASLHFFSVGDLTLVAGISIFLLPRLYQKLLLKIDRSDRGRLTGQISASV